MAGKHDKEHVLVSFFEKKRRTMSWVHISKIQPWNEEVNEIMLLQKKGFKESYLKAMHEGFEKAKDNAIWRGDSAEVLKQNKRQTRKSK